MRIDWTCDPTRVESLVQRVRDEIAAVRDTLLMPDQMARAREVLLRELERSNRDNGYVLNQIARRYEDDDAEHLAAATAEPAQIAALSGYAIQLAAMKYLDPAD